MRVVEALAANADAEVVAAEVTSLRRPDGRGCASHRGTMENMKTGGAHPLWPPPLSLSSPSDPLEE